MAPITSQMAVPQPPAIDAEIGTPIMMRASRTVVRTRLAVRVLIYFVRLGCVGV
jgi:hypothetical protein